MSIKISISVGQYKTMKFKLHSFFAVFCLSLTTLWSQSVIQDEAQIRSILENPELAGYAISCRDDAGKYNALEINSKANSIDCPEKAQFLKIEVINAQIVSPPPVSDQFKAAARFFSGKKFFIYQCNQLLLEGRSYLLFYYRKTESDPKSEMVLFP